ncbi:unnamed protein product [Vitrella brassicaformis CCMP3155]|uniref:Amine oxidase domain-containing protein n=2 Tax=Vitrella brassicaformis TaxID=1169539 RepID=A0A0G4G4C8_VITBC|nr:unnamed protein product [Vitrella brassicaformis CCMP3155]|mmetsp:Transcript_28415/g.81872  ORF Transcript_28415/g.81872 Transcript_28415/m.81872 type:complete len:409 (+) Transcript_28415:167-1393(+)|eukprot:CEM22779.1 unnamed protein product [Vitrella brassicaformis CCMP3155]
MAAFKHQRVAVIGAGVTGSTIAHQLSRSGLPIAIDVFEMGRGPGGRASTRFTRQLPGVWYNHGAPCFHVCDPAVTAFIESLAGKQCIEEYKGKVMSIDWATKGVRQADTTRASHGSSGDAETCKIYRGVPHMASLCSALLEGDNITKREQTMIVEYCFDKTTQQWRLVDKQAKEYAGYDYLIITSVTNGHPRFQKTFGLPPPLTVAGDRLAAAQVSDAVQRVAAMMGEVKSDPIFSLMVTYPVSDAPPSLPFDCLLIENGMLSKVVQMPLPTPSAGHSPSPSHVSFVAHSTPAFAEEHISVSASSDPDALDRLAKTMADHLKMVLQTVAKEAASKMDMDSPAAVQAHRWGSCFPVGVPDGLRGRGCVGDEKIGVYVAGDFMVAASVEGAMSSALVTSEKVMSQVRAKL